MRTITALFAGLAGVSLCRANISGRVTDTGGVAIPGALVKLGKGGQTATTGADGSFTLMNTAVISGMGNQSLRRELSAAVHDGSIFLTVAQ